MLALGFFIIGYIFVQIDNINDLSCSGTYGDYLDPEILERYENGEEVSMKELAQISSHQIANSGIEIPTLDTWCIVKSEIYAPFFIFSFLVGALFIIMGFMEGKKK